MATFYDDLPVIDSITQVTDNSIYRNVPENWYVVLCDIENSTTAIEAGRYRDVNAISGATIAAMLNIAPGTDLPFVFGGGGATILIPPEFLEKARAALVTTQKLAVEQFKLDLRIGIIPVKDIVDVGYEFNVAKLRTSENFQQAIISGGGLTYAEALLKDPDYYAKYTVPDEGKYEADYTGFECRWNAIPSPYDETISLLVNALPDSLADRNAVYQRVIERIETIYGNSKTRHPIATGQMQLAWNPMHFKTEGKIRSNSTAWRVLWRLFKGTNLGRLGILFKVGQWGQYKGMVVEATDNEKFDDTLRMIISGTAIHRQALEAFLETEHQARMLVYGMHASEHCLMTCIVFDYFGRQMHFVDGAGGGYAFAARQMKQQLRAVQMAERS
jgi:hypothetical protein